MAPSLEQSLAAANELSNPLSGMKAFSSFELRPKRGNEVINRPPRRLRIDFMQPNLSNELHKSMIDLFERNMGEMYRSSSWGLNLKSKAEELRHPNSRFLIVTAEGNGSNAESGDSSPHPSPGKLLAFSHFRFEPDDDDHPTEAVLYVFEIQVDQSVQRCGLGRHLMSMMEIVAMRANMKRVMLTVFKNNATAMNFYRKRMKYSIAECSPSNFVGGDDAEYEILDKKVSK